MGKNNYLQTLIRGMSDQIPAPETTQTQSLQAPAQMSQEQMLAYYMAYMQNTAAQAFLKEGQPAPNVEPNQEGNQQSGGEVPTYFYPFGEGGGFTPKTAAPPSNQFNSFGGGNPRQQQAPGGRSFVDHSRELQYGEWRCPTCRLINFRSRQDCFKCHIDRAQATEDTIKQGGGNGGSQRYGSREGGGSYQGGGSRNYENRGRDSRPDDRYNGSREGGYNRGNRNDREDRFERGGNNERRGDRGERGGDYGDRDRDRERDRDNRGFRNDRGDRGMRGGGDRSDRNDRGGRGDRPDRGDYKSRGGRRADYNDGDRSRSRYDAKKRDRSPEDA
eukprot:TRINITY_DN1429_c0_g1_i2.p1 TRINITY_DN1429_c0_g1~~TRINITY_DN1429_c0_g1_i2.p1  ORF type:complete len:330 (+),score=57.20 TRINITY_DN1429_c0_g1_i2:3-992(+)